MPFPRKLLIEHEELVLELRPHWIALVMPAIVTILVIVGWSLAVANGPDSGSGHDAVFWGATAVAIFVLFWFPVRKFIAWATSYFVVTTDRVIHREGWIAKRSMEIPLEAINDVRFESGIIDRIVGAGTLRISSAADFGTSSFDDIRHPEEVQKTIYHQGELNKKRMYQGDRAVTPPPPAPAIPPAAPSSTTELERLAKLRADGVLTEDEFQAQKAKILGQS
jgi:uncharacterized membrane protein YdbT with pleckstrin-like domain